MKRRSRPVSTRRRRHGPGTSGGSCAPALEGYVTTPSVNEPLLSPEAPRAREAFASTARARCPVGDDGPSPFPSASGASCRRHSWSGELHLPFRPVPGRRWHLRPGNQIIYLEACIQRIQL
ncbi:hypothetical protein E2562_006488 [Oryza meyeriana var. granulata]|uniref:Uncharacterized protein n=1 Tax=Oryza meyeriana var. granulata TaxID=110450 RepID=A0A6G1CNY4_9ORYZ|nr:hypothetical protein E2562_006488 [Oryza meyeriana var. granulata]